MLGKLAPKFDRRTLRLASYVPKRMLPPRSADYTKAVKKLRWPMLANDRHPCCTCSAAGHMIQVWTANAGKERILQNRAVIETYKRFVGDTFKPHKHMLDVLNFWRKTGIGGDRIMAYVILSPQDKTQVKTAIDLFGTCYIGLALPDFAVKPPSLAHFLKTRWAVPPKGPRGHAEPRRTNGHTVAAVKYDANSLYVVTWGKLKAMTWDFYDAYMEEAYAVLSPDFMSKNRISPSAFDLARLKRDLRNAAARKPSARLMGR